MKHLLSSIGLSGLNVPLSLRQEQRENASSLIRAGGMVNMEGGAVGPPILIRAQKGGGRGR